MTVGVIGLGLIGGSLAKSVKKHTDYTVLGRDIEPSVVLRAKLIEAIDGELSDDKIGSCDVILLALYPADAIYELERIAPMLTKDVLVTDACGVKRHVTDACQTIARAHGFTFIGGHPMAGVEKSGFAHSTGTMFEGASMILTPPGDVDLEKLKACKDFFLSIGFGRITIRTSAEHDAVIAYTSQLAHVLSSAYAKSPTALRHGGLSAGSFQDMTRVATLSEGMWSELFLDNADMLLPEIESLSARLLEYADAIRDGDRARLESLLRAGCEQKARVLQDTDA